MVKERVLEWDGEEYFLVLYSRDAGGNVARDGIPGITTTDAIVWDCHCSENLVPTREVGLRDPLTPKEVWELEQQWSGTH